MTQEKVIDFYNQVIEGQINLIIDPKCELFEALADRKEGKNEIDCRKIS